MPSIYLSSVPTPHPSSAGGDRLEIISTPLPIWGLPTSSLPASQPKPSTSSSSAQSHTLSLNMASNYVVFLPNKIAYHLLCFEKIGKHHPDGSTATPTTS
jgi:hypothetical protein